MTPGNRFTDEELAAWRPNLISWQLIERDLERQLQRDSGMPHAYYAILVVLNEQHSMPFAALAAELDYSPSRMSHAVARLEDSGWVEREPDVSDRRVTRLRLTGEGRRALAAASVGHVAQVRSSFFAHLDDRDLADLARIGGKLYDGLTGGRPGALGGPGASRRS